jgi:hypothetical protein
VPQSPRQSLHDRRPTSRQALRLGSVTNHVKKCRRQQRSGLVKSRFSINGAQQARAGDTDAAAFQRTCGDVHNCLHPQLLCKHQCIRKREPPLRISVHDLRQEHSQLRPAGRCMQWQREASDARSSGRIRLITCCLVAPLALTSTVLPLEADTMSDGRVALPSTMFSVAGQMKCTCRSTCCTV